MLKVSSAVLASVERGAAVKKKVRVHFQNPEDYTEDDFLIEVGSINTSMSSDGGYEISNTSVTLKNQDFYFSQKFASELPVDKLVEIFFCINTTDVLVFRGLVADWEIQGSQLTLNTNA